MTAALLATFQCHHQLITQRVLCPPVVFQPQPIHDSLSLTHAFVRTKQRRKSHALLSETHAPRDHGQQNRNGQCCVQAAVKLPESRSAKIRRSTGTIR
jgi:hypothetical protein